MGEDRLRKHIHGGGNAAADANIDAQAREARAHTFHVNEVAPLQHAEARRLDLAAPILPPRSCRRDFAANECAQKRTNDAA